jgi:hypothetical protein
MFFRASDSCKILVSLFIALNLFSSPSISDPGSQVSNAYYTINSGAFETCSAHTDSSIYDQFFILQSVPDIHLTSSDYYLIGGFVNLMGLSSVLSPIISSIDPVNGYNIAPVHIDKIGGVNFSSKVTVKLSSSGEADIIAKNILVPDSTQINCDLDITGAKAGFWDVVVSSEGNPASSLHNGFEVKSYSYAINLAINSPNPFDNTRENTTIAYRLEQNTDVNIYVFSSTGNLIYKDAYSSGMNGGRAGDNSISWNGVSYYSEVLSNGVYLLHVVERQTGKTLAKGKIMIVRR